MVVESYDIAIIGAGLVGLTYASVFAKNGAEVAIYDIDSARINRLKEGLLPFYDKSLSDFVKENPHVWNRLSFTTDIEEALRHKVLVICISTYEQGKYTDKFLFQFFKSITGSNNTHVFVIKSTVRPGTTRRVKGMLENTGLRYGEDFYLIYNPEFLRSGFAVQDALNPGKIVAGLNYAEEKRVIEDLYSFVPSDVPRIYTNWETAELIKVAQNAFLAMKISFANDLMYVAFKNRLHIDFKILGEALGLDPRIGRYGLYPGLGFGGSCLQKDAELLAEMEAGMEYSLLQEVIRINKENIDKLIDILERKIGEIKNKNVLVVGLSFKEGTSDLRESKALELALKLKEKGNSVFWYDEDIRDLREVEGIKPADLSIEYDLVLLTKRVRLEGIKGKRVIGLRADLPNFIL